MNWFTMERDEKKNVVDGFNSLDLFCFFALGFVDGRPARFFIFYLGRLGPGPVNSGFNPLAGRDGEFGEKFWRPASSAGQGLSRPL